MKPEYWENIFVKNGWPVIKLGENTELKNGDVVIVGELDCTPDILKDVRNETGIFDTIIMYRDFEDQ